jgi:hypothetical protein
MVVTETDRHYFSVVVDRIQEVYEMASEFVSYNGAYTTPAEKIVDLAILEFKTWLTSNQGQSWMGTMGYSFSQSFLYPDISVCPVCSGILSVSDHNVCESCGVHVCSPCSEIVDSSYGIRWCVSCVSGYGLTNF